MGVETEKFIRKPLYVEAVRVTDANFDDLVAWCQGEVLSEPMGGKLKKYIKVRVHHPTKNPRQTKAFVGDWLLYTEFGGYKVYTNKAFRATFDLVTEEDRAGSPEPKEYPYEEGETTVLGPEIFVGRVEGQPVINWRGENFVPQQVPELEAAAPVIEEPYGDTAGPDAPAPIHVEEPIRAASAETVARANEETDDEVRVIDDVTIHSVSAVAEKPSPATGVQPIESVEAAVDAHTTPQGEPHEYVQASPAAIAGAVNEQEQARQIEEQADPIPEQPPEVAAAGKRVLSEEEQTQMGPDAVRELLQSGDVVLAQDLAA